MSSSSSLANFTQSLPERDKKVLVGIVLAVAVALATLPFAAHELFYGHDLLFHLTRIQSIADGLAQGQFPVYLHDGFAYGYGYASGVCYPDLFLYFPALLVLAGLRLKRAFLVFMLVENLFCAFCAYFCFKRMFSSRTIGLALAVLWTLANYRLIDMVLRTAVGEGLALVFFPLVAYGIWAICLANPAHNALDKRLGWIALGVGVACIVQSHVLSVVLVLLVGVPVALAMAVVGVRSQASSPGRIVADVAKSVVLCAGLSLVFIVPFLDYYLTEPLSVHAAELHARKYAIEPLQLFALFWPLSGSSLFAHEGIVGEMPFALGWALAMGLPALCAVLALRSVRQEAGKPAVAKMVILLVAALVFCWMCTLLFPWRNGPGEGGLIGTLVGPLTIIQFPWRLVGPVSFLLVLGLGLVFKHGAAIGRIALAACLCLAFVECGVALTTFASNVPMLGEGDNAHLETKDAILLMYGEYVPLDAKEAGYLQVEGADYTTKVLHDNPFANGPKASNGVEVASWEHDKVVRLSLDYAAKGNSAGSIQLPLLAYSEWTMVKAPDGCALSSQDGFVSVDVPAGSSGTVEVVYVVPIAWRIALVVSALTAAVLVFVVFGLVRRR